MPYQYKHPAYPLSVAASDSRGAARLLLAKVVLNLLDVH